jgi:hypothetical protein
MERRKFSREIKREVVKLVRDRSVVVGAVGPPLSYCLALK